MNASRTVQVARLGSASSSVRAHALCSAVFIVSLATPMAAQTHGICTTAVASGYQHCLALRGDGTVLAWGRNGDVSQVGGGQLGDGTTTSRSTPVQVLGLSDVTAIAAGGLHSLALLSDGTVRAWGDNLFGQLGDGTTDHRVLAVAVPALTDVTAISAGAGHSLALGSDGTVWSWGGNSYGQLGDGTTTPRLSPVHVPGLTDVIAVVAGIDQSLALKSDGSAWAWGRNDLGELGDGTRTNRPLPVPVSGLTGVIAIGTGYYEHGLALKSDGTVWAWGFNRAGQVGDGTTTMRLSPVQVRGLSGVTRIAGGNEYSLAVEADGTAWAWGYNFWGRLGDGTTTDRHVPVRVSGLTGLASIAAGEEHSLALAGDGVWTWGWNHYGELGDGTFTDRAVPGQVSGLERIDSDADAIDDACDCAPLDASNLAPTAIVDLHVRGEGRLTWTQPPTADVSDVHSGTIAALWTDPGTRNVACLASGIAPPILDDARPLVAAQPGTGFYYLVAARNACGWTMAPDSLGDARPVAPCP